MNKILASAILFAISIAIGSVLLIGDLEKIDFVFSASIAGVSIFLSAIFLATGISEYSEKRIAKLIDSQ